MENKYVWLTKRSLRSVMHLNLWSENPRLNPELEYRTFKSIVSGLISSKKERDNFVELVESIAKYGFIPADPIVIFFYDEKWYVAEGNRRVAAIRLLIDPSKAPRSIKATIRKYSRICDIENLTKIYVAIAPSLDEVEWYINQRNGILSLNYSWTRIQQIENFSRLYEKYHGDMEKVRESIGVGSNDLDVLLRMLKIKNFSKLPQVQNFLTEDEIKEANSHSFPITIIERFFGFSVVREAWGIIFDGANVNLIFDNDDGFYYAYAHLLKRILSVGDDKINTRMKKEDLSNILGSLPKIENKTIKPKPESPIPDSVSTSTSENTSTSSPEEMRPEPAEEIPSSPATPPTPPPVPVYKNPNRKKLNYEKYFIDTTEFKLSAIFDELKCIPTKTYPFATSALIRIFLDVAVLVYIQSEGLESNISKSFQRGLRSIELSNRLEFLKKDSPLKSNKNCVKIINGLLDSESTYSLDILNGYMHSASTHYNRRDYLNNFWDFLLPLFETMFKIDKI